MDLSAHHTKVEAEWVDLLLGSSRAEVEVEVDRGWVWVWVWVWVICHLDHPIPDPGHIKDTALDLISIPLAKDQEELVDEHHRLLRASRSLAVIYRKSLLVYRIETAASQSRREGFTKIG